MFKEISMRGITLQKVWKRSYHHANRGSFFQEQPSYANPYLHDNLLSRYLNNHLPSSYYDEVNAELTKFGDIISTDVHARGLDCEKNPPHLQQFNAWGNRIDEIITCDSWKFMKRFSAREGVIALGYDKNYKEFGRLYQFAKLFLFAPSSGLFSCPLAMVDGAAAVLQQLESQSLFTKETFRKLTTRNPDEFWTSGQWMTERKGGSDVAGGTETIAHRQQIGSFKLYGYKWFTSATDADVTLTLARIVQPDGSTIQGSRGLSLFILPIKDDKSNLHSKLNGLEVQRLKDKLGTRQLPTSEMLLDGTTAYLLGDEGRGVKNISTMLTLTRIHNSIASVSNMRKIIQLATDYSMKREAFGKKICNYSLHVKTLAEMDVRTRASFLLTFELIRLLGKEENDKATEQEKQLLRLLTPLTKLHTAKEAVAIASEGLECFGGQGYLEDTGLPAMLRDAQVLSIWEGTTNILSLDVLRAIAKSNGDVLEAFFSSVNHHVTAAKASNNKGLEQAISKVSDATKNIQAFVATAGNSANHDYHARELAYSLAKTYAGALMLSQACSKHYNKQDITAVNIWCQGELCVLNSSDISNYDDLKDLVYH